MLKRFLSVFTEGGVVDLPENSGCGTCLSSQQHHSSDTVSHSNLYKLPKYLSIIIISPRRPLLTHLTRSLSKTLVFLIANSSENEQDLHERGGT